MSLAGIDTNFTLPRALLYKHRNFQGGTWADFFTVDGFMWACERGHSISQAIMLLLKIGTLSFFSAADGTAEMCWILGQCMPAPRPWTGPGVRKATAERSFVPTTDWTYDLDGNLLRARAYGSRLSQGKFRTEPNSKSPWSVVLIYVCL